jgi:hypothetical protein
MFGFPNKSDLSDLIGNNLIMVCCNANQIYLHFDSQIRISIDTNQFQIKLDNKIIKVHIPIDNLAIFDFIENKVENISVNADNSVLEIAFRNHSAIILTDDKHYNSHIIQIGSKEILV